MIELFWRQREDLVILWRNGELLFLSNRIWKNTFSQENTKKRSKNKVEFYQKQRSEMSLFVLSKT